MIASPKPNLHVKEMDALPAPSDTSHAALVARNPDLKAKLQRIDNRLGPVDLTPTVAQLEAFVVEARARIAPRFSRELWVSLTPSITATHLYVTDAPGSYQNWSLGIFDRPGLGLSCEVVYSYPAAEMSVIGAGKSFDAVRAAFDAWVETLEAADVEAQAAHVLAAATL